MTYHSRDYGIRTIFQKHYYKYLDTHPDVEYYKHKTAMQISSCKTGELGYNISVCEKCGHPLIHAVSCNNRSCPCCQAPLEKKWEMERNTELIEGIAYYHVVFTVPKELNQLIKLNFKLLIDLFFKCVSDTLITLCADPKFMGARPGIVSVLHTWGQKLNFHPHIHTCVSGGGITPAGKFVETTHKGFFLPETVIADMFRGKYLCSLKKYHDKNLLTLPDALKDKDTWKTFIDRLFTKRWLPFVKETFNGKGNAIKYLARYSFRTAIANSRIVSVDGENVIFTYKDYTDDNKVKELTVSGTEFIELFLQHILPPGFHRVRFSGYLTNCNKTKNLKLIHKLRNTAYKGNPYRKMKVADLLMNIYGTDICKCSMCSGHMIQYARGLPESDISLLLAKIDSAVI